MTTTAPRTAAPGRLGVMLSKHALEGIASYKYKPGSYTWLDSQLNGFWLASCELLPIWMAPNLVTMVGTCFMFLTMVVQLVYSPTLVEDAPTWVYLLSAFGVFFYQTMDALDGKQARRTGSSSPLGQLFDHGCDALSTLFNVLSCAATMHIGPTLHAFAITTSVSITFYLAQWDEYHTGVMSCSNGFVGVTEAQFVLVAVHLLTAIFGGAFWQVPIAFGWLTPAVVVELGLVIGNVTLVYDNLVHVFTSPHDTISPEENGHKQRSKPLAAFQLVPVLMAFVLSFLWISGPDATNYRLYPVLYLVGSGITYIFFSTRMIVSHMCKIPFTPQFRAVIPFALLVLNDSVPLLRLKHAPVLRPLYASLLYTIYIVLLYLHYVVHVVNDICWYLNIFLFKIKAKV